MKNTRMILACVAALTVISLAACQNTQPAAPATTTPAAPAVKTTPGSVTATAPVSLGILPSSQAPILQPAEMTILPSGQPAQPQVAQTIGQTVSPAPAAQPQPGQVMSPPVKATELMAAYEVKITKDGFDPKILELPIGGTVTFVNMDDASHQPSSKSGSCPEFAAVKSLAKGEKAVLTFADRAMCPYIDSLNPKSILFSGRILVR
jgi:plastocyanin